ncbi:MAG: AbrB/MazE/SpoVT family DNA-binding domain-containing protein [Thermoplasmata archaeon]
MRRTSRVQVVSGSFLVALPKDWGRQVGLERGDPVEVEYNDERVVITRARKSAASSAGERNPGAPAPRPVQPAETDERGLADGGS